MSGSYEGQIVAVWLPDGRNMQLQQAFTYIDSASLRWDVPGKATVDGASIPRFLWTVAGGPFEGKYRDASVVHDWFCDVRTRPWRAVHRMFFEAMLTSGVGTVKAKAMYAGVMLGGPKWSENAVSNASLATMAARIALNQSSLPVERMGTRSATIPGMLVKQNLGIRSAGFAGERDTIRILADDLSVSPARIVKATRRTQSGRKQPQQPAVQYRPTKAKAARVLQAAASLELDDIDAMIERETKGLKLMPVK